MMALTLVKKHHNLVESCHEVHVVVTIFLDLQDQCQLRAIVGCESLEELGVVSEMAQRLVSNQLFFLVPFAQLHDRCPDDCDNLMLWNDVLFRQLLDICDDILLGFVVLDVVNDCLLKRKKNDKVCRSRLKELRNNS